MSQGRNFFEEWKQKRAQEPTEGAAPADGALAAPRTIEEQAVSLKDVPELFQWTEERDKAIQELLETTVPGTLPSVHQQLQSMRNAILDEKLSKERARELLAEVNAYLASHLRTESGKTPSSHAGLNRARNDKLNGLYAWQQCSDALRDYLDKGEDVYLEVAAYAGDQGSAFLASARRQLLESEPEPDGYEEPEEEDDEEED